MQHIWDTNAEHRVLTKTQKSMRTANNNFTVETLVAKYRNYVEDHASSKFISCDDFGDTGSMEYEIDGWADYQLLITLYNDFAGEKADPSVQKRLSKYGEHFWKDVLNTEEYSFLLENFKDTVDYIFSKGLHFGSDATRNSFHLMKAKDKFIQKAVKYVSVKPGNSIFLERDTLGDGAMLFPQCVVLCDNDYSDESALKKIRMFAADIQYRNFNKIEEETIDIIISSLGGFFIPLETLYNTLADNGTMFIQAPFPFMVSMDKDAVSFRKRLVADKALKTIIKYSESSSIFRYVIAIEKKKHSEVDVQDRVNQIFSKVDIEKISDQIFLPGYYLTEKSENGVPLSDFLDYYDSNNIKNNYIKRDVSAEQPVIFPNDLGCTFKDANISLRHFKKGTEYDLISSNPESYCYNVDFPCIFLYGGTENVYVGIAQEIESPYAVLEPIACFTAKEGIDLRYVASLLFNPIVEKQISAIYQDFYLGGMMASMSLFLHSIIVPYHYPNKRDYYLAEACYKALCITQVELKQENEFYRKAIRMRKHALTQSLSSIEAMFYALNSYREKHDVLNNEDIISRVKKTTVHEAFEYIAQSLKDMMPALEHIATVEYSFGKPEWIDPEKFIEEYILQNEKGWLTFKPVITWEKGNNQAAEDIWETDPFTGMPLQGRPLFMKGESKETFLFPKDALKRILNNIISNAQEHGFTDKSRKDYKLQFSWRSDSEGLYIEIENNGTPIPSDRDTSSLLEYGVSTALHHDGHNGIGCNEIDDIMKQHDGKVEIVSSPKNEFTVKYILTFNRSNTVGSFKI